MRCKACEKLCQIDSRLNQVRRTPFVPSSPIKPTVDAPMPWKSSPAHLWPTVPDHQRQPGRQSVKPAQVLIHLPDRPVDARQAYQQLVAQAVERCSSLGDDTGSRIGRVCPTAGTARPAAGAQAMGRWRFHQRAFCREDAGQSISSWVCNGDDNVALFGAGLDVAVCFGDLFQRIAPVDDHL